MATTGDTDEGVLDAVRGGAAAVVAGLVGAGSRQDWIDLAATCQGLMNTVAAVQERAVAEVARREQVWLEDGTLGERVHGPGRVAIDAADLVAPSLGCSHAQAQRRVEQAVRVAAGRSPVEVDDADAPEATGLGGLHVAMAHGRIDGYRAGVLAHELEEAPAEVADAVVAALDPHLHEDAPALRRRCRRLLARVSPDLLRQRAVRARAATGLRRWASEPGVEAWYGTFPSEDAAQAWMAIDRRAHELVAAGRLTSVERARGKALTDLVLEHSAVSVQVALAVPADTPAPPPTTDGSGVSVPGRRPQDLVQVQGGRPGEPMLVPAGWLRDHTAPLAATVVCDPDTGARLDGDDSLAGEGYRPSPRLVSLVRARDGRCRFPGCSVAARFCDLDHARPWPAGPTSARNLLCLCRRHHRIKQSAGWSLRLGPDAVATWTDPAGRVRRTDPVDSLDTVVLAATEPAEPPAPPPDPPDAPPTWSPLECRLELLGDQQRAAAGSRVHCVRPDGLRIAFRHRRHAAPAAPDPPPF